MFTQSITPAMRSHMEVQLAFLTDLSRKMFDAVQKISELNMQIAQQLMVEITHTNQQLLTAKSPSEFAAMAATQIQPATEKLRQYQHQLSNVMASANVEMTKTAENHMPEASRTAAAVADELVRTASEQTEKASQRQREAMERMNQAARREANGAGQGQIRGTQPQHGQTAH